MEPVEAAGLAIGVASLAFEVFQGVLEGFEAFESAATANEECESYRVKLRVQYGRIYTWGVTTKLADPSSHGVYDRRMKSHRALVTAILGELERLLRRLRKLDLAYDKVVDRSATSRNVVVEAPTTNAKQKDVSDPSKKGVAEMGSDSHLTDAEWEKYEGLFGIQTVTGSVIPRIAPKGFNHAAVWIKGGAKIAKQPKRVLWALRDKSKYSTDLDRVEELVNYLHETITDDQLYTIQETNNKNNLMLLQLTANIKEIHDIQLATQSTRSLSGTTAVEDRTTATSSDLPDFHTVGYQHRDAFSKVLSFSIAANSADKKPAHGTRIRSKDRHLIKDIKELEQGMRSSATLEGHGAVWIEWKSYLPIDLRTRDPSPEARDRVEALVSLLTMEKPEEFCVPRCIRYFVDRTTDKFGVVFQMPPGAPGDAEPRSLLSMLDTAAVRLQSRVMVAQQLSQGLLYLHAVNWLHKGMRSASVLFFQSPDTKHLEKPFISGFEYARIVKQGSTTGGPPYEAERAIYMHPDYLDPNARHHFRKTFDIYGLGIVLIELACWKRIDELLQLPPEVEANSPRPDNEQATAGAARDGDEDADEDDDDDDDDDEPPANVTTSKPKPSLNAILSIRSQILDKSGSILDQVEAAMGSNYRKAVHSCVTGMEAFGLSEEKDQADPVIGALLQQAFIAQVVDPLMSIQV